MAQKCLPAADIYLRGSALRYQYLALTLKLVVNKSHVEHGRVDLTSP